MITDIHFLRPWWLLMIIPLLGLAFASWRRRPKLHAWAEICDPHLLNHLLQKKSKNNELAQFLVYYSACSL